MPLQYREGLLTIKPWSNWSPTFIYATGTPTGVTYTSRWVQIGKIAFFSIFWTCTAGNGCTGIQISLPALCAYDAVCKWMSWPTVLDLHGYIRASTDYAYYVVTRTILSNDEHRITGFYEVN